jgi:lysozyme
MALAISPAGVRFVAQWEGFRGHLYNDVLGHCTIGYGHLVHRGNCNGSEPARFRHGLTQAQALDLLHADLAGFVDGVRAGLRVAVNQHQFDALVSFAYNVGVGGFTGSTLLRKLNAGNAAAVPGELMRWTNGGLPGLVRRRRAEGELFAHGRYAVAGLGPEGEPGPEQRREADVVEGPEPAA